MTKKQLSNLKRSLSLLQQLPWKSGRLILSFKKSPDTIIVPLLKKEGEPSSFNVFSLFNFLFAQDRQLSLADVIFAASQAAFLLSPVKVGNFFSAAVHGHILLHLYVFSSFLDQRAFEALKGTVPYVADDGTSFHLPSPFPFSLSFSLFRFIEFTPGKLRRVSFSEFFKTIAKRKASQASRKKVESSRQPPQPSPGELRFLSLAEAGKIEQAWEVADLHPPQHFSDIYEHIRFLAGKAYRFAGSLAVFRLLHPDPSLLTFCGLEVHEKNKRKGIYGCRGVFIPALHKIKLARAAYVSHSPFHALWFEQLLSTSEPLQQHSSFILAVYFCDPSSIPDFFKKAHFRLIILALDAPSIAEQTRAALRGTGKEVVVLPPSKKPDPQTVAAALSFVLS